MQETVLTDKIIIQTFQKSKELMSLLGNNGNIELLYELKDESLLYTELQRIVTDRKLFSDSTFNRNLNKLQDLKIINKLPERSKNRETHRYCLSRYGNEIIKQITRYEKSINLDSNQKQLELEK